MKTMNRAALLLSAIFLLPQATLAGKPDKPPKPAPEECTLTVLDTACSADIKSAFYELNTFKPAFSSRNGDKDYIGLTCKLARAEVKMSQDKPADAYAKLADSATKVRTLLSQNKFDLELVSAEEVEALAVSIDTAATCAYNQAYPVK